MTTLLVLLAGVALVVVRPGDLADDDGTAAAGPTTTSAPVTTTTRPTTTTPTDPAALAPGANPGSAPGGTGSTGGTGSPGGTGAGGTGGTGGTVTTVAPAPATTRPAPTPTTAGDPAAGRDTAAPSRADGDGPTRLAETGGVGGLVALGLILVLMGKAARMSASRR